MRGSHRHLSSSGSASSDGVSAGRKSWISLYRCRSLSGDLSPLMLWHWISIGPPKRGCRLLLKDPFLQQLRSSMQDEDLEKRSLEVCLGSSFAEHKRIKRNFYHFKSLFLSKRRNEKPINITTIKRSPIVYNSSFYSNSNLTSCSTHQSSMKRKRKSSSLSTHYSEVNHRTPKAVLSYGPNIGHIPHVRQEHIR